MTLPVVAAGWYADPAGEGELRWWNGRGWTRHVHPSPAPATRPATFGARASAYLMDALLLWPLSLGLFWPFHRQLFDELNGLLVSSILTQGNHWPGWFVLFDSGLVQLWLVAAIPGVLLRVAYDLLCLCRSGATWGQQRSRLLVRDDRAGAGAPSGHRDGLSLRQALVRSLVLRVAAPTVVGWLLVVLWPLWDPRGRSLADVVAGTRVDAQPPAWARTWG